MLLSTLDHFLTLFINLHRKTAQSSTELQNTVCIVVKRIMEPILDTGTNFTLDHYFSSVPVAENSKFNHKFTILCTLRRN